MNHDQHQSVIRVRLAPDPPSRGGVLAAPAGATLAQALFLSGYFTGKALCSGLGRCGLCRVRYVSEPPDPTARETRKIDGEALIQGWRLACQHPALAAGAHETVLDVPAWAKGPPRAVPVSAPVRPGLVLAVDLGTTSLEWAAVEGGAAVASGKEINPQMGAGAEVVSRLAFAARDADFLRGLLLDWLRGVVASLPGRPESLCLAGNPAMTLILLGRDLSGLSAAPYRLDYAGGVAETLAPDLPQARIAPLLGPFVGGDISAGLTHLLTSRASSDFPFILADLGTNGEFVLALSPDQFVAASAPMGPALEGSGLTHGRLAGPGCAVGFDFTPAGIVPRLYEGKGSWDGSLSGTGYLSLVAGLVRLGLIRPDGLFAVPAGDLAGNPGPAALARRLGLTFVRDAGEAGLGLGTMTLWASDVEELLKVKAAANAVLSRLMREAYPGGAPACPIHLAGALGYHAEFADLETLGFLAPGQGARALRAGNASLAGALDLARDPAAWERARGLRARCRVLDLALDAGFEADYLSRMVFSYVS